jgi:spore coat protein CotH
MTRPGCIRGLVLAAGVLVAGQAAAQTADDLFNADVLQRIDLLVNSADWEALKAAFEENTYYPTDLRWNGQTVRNVGIRSRGSGSRSGTKPGLRVDFDRYATSQTFLGLKSVVLDNLTQDPTGMKERVAMRLYERLGLSVPREAHAQLYVNNQYAGVYAVVESIDKDFLRRVFGGPEGSVENDGYLFEYEYSSEWFFTYPGQALEPYALLFDPVTHESAPMAELYAPLEAMFRAISEASPGSLTAALDPYLDLALLMKHLAVQNFVAQLDGILGYAGVNNFYLYRFENSSRSQFIAWDEDNAFYAVDFPILQGHERNELMRRAMQVPPLRTAYLAALLEAAASAIEPVDEAGTTWLEHEVQQQGSLITAAMTADPVTPFSNDEFAAGVAALLAFGPARAAFVRCEVAKLADPEGAAAICGF